MPPDPLPDGLSAEQLELVGQVHDANADGSLLVGRADWTYVSEDGSGFQGGSTGFAWTAKSGTVSLPRGLSAALVASDGGVWGPRVEPDKLLGFSRWDMSSRTRLFDLDLQASSGSLVEVSQNAKVAAGWLQAQNGQTTTLLWRSERDADRFIPVSIPGGGSQPDLSADGSRLIAVSDEMIYQASTSGRSVEPSSIVAPAAYSRCNHAAVSTNGGVVAGVCARDANEQGPPAVLFRWTEQDGVQVIQPGPNNSIVMSGDGNNLLGSESKADDSFGLSWWMPTGVVEEPIRGEVVGLTDNAKVAWVTIVDASGQNGVQDTTAARWTREGGVVRLDKLHDGPTRVVGYSRTGSLAVGGSDPAYLWDELGARDILRELDAAEVALQGVTRFEPERVWSGDPIRIQGRCYVGGSALRLNACLVTLPARN